MSLMSNQAIAASAGAVLSCLGWTQDDVMIASMSSAPAAAHHHHGLAAEIAHLRQLRPPLVAALVA
ncbi:MAG: hypothetical protein MUE77_10580 [Sandarakinorhabdus sp.]|nr:hypothetical protein [Sandarakinorhabdus sp.]